MTPARAGCLRGLDVGKLIGRIVCVIFFTFFVTVDYNTTTTTIPILLLFLPVYVSQFELPQSHPRFFEFPLQCRNMLPYLRRRRRHSSRSRCSRRSGGDSSGTGPASLVGPDIGRVYGFGARKPRRRLLARCKDIGTGSLEASLSI